VRLVFVVPARLGSTRLPQKPLRLLAGRPLIRVVAERVCRFGLGRVVVASDDQRVLDAAAPEGVDTVLTDPAHRSGTERVAEVARMPAYATADLFVNVQGDEPFVPEAAVTGSVSRVAGGDEIGTAAMLLDPAQRHDPNRVKVRVDARGRALGFSRTLAGPACCWGSAVFQHLGVYAYRPAALARWTALPPTADEVDERLEQLRPLAHGMRIGVATVYADATTIHGIDTEADLRLAEAGL